jgi:hypothetical protein
MEDQLRSQLETGDTVGLYSTQRLTNGLFAAAVKHGRTDLLDSLVELYLVPSEYLQEADTYNYYNLPGGDGRVTEGPLPEPTRMWLGTDSEGVSGTESTLNVSQFLFLISSSIASIQTLPDRTPAMERLVETYWPVLIEHYRRWIFDKPGPFQVRGWGCADGNFNHSEFVDAKLARSLGDSKSYCNAVLDRDMWIISGVAEALASGLPIEPELRARFHDYAIRGVALIESRTEPTELRDFEGRSVQGRVFDPGAWRDHPDSAFAGYTGETFPTEDDRRLTADDLGWDFSHATRYVEVFGSLYLRRDILDTDFPSRQTLEGFANQVAYAIFNGDLEMPLFANFFDGTNGWFRVNYSGREGFAYAPYDLSASMIYGSYGLWSEFNPDLVRIMHALWTMITSDRPDVVQHRTEHYEQRFYYEYERSGSDIFDLNGSSRLLPFLSSFPIPREVYSFGNFDVGVP